MKRKHWQQRLKKRELRQAAAEIAGNMTAMSPAGVPVPHPARRGRGRERRCPAPFARAPPSAAASTAGAGRPAPRPPAIPRPPLFVPRPYLQDVLQHVCLHRGRPRPASPRRRHAPPPPPSRPGPPAAGTGTGNGPFHPVRARRYHPRAGGGRAPRRCPTPALGPPPAPPRWK